MKIKILSSILVLTLFILFLIFICPDEKTYRVERVISPCEVILDRGFSYKIEDLNTFDSYFSENNRILAAKLDLSEEEAFVMGNFGKYWAKNILGTRKVHISGNDLIYYKFGYRTRLMNSPYCIKDGHFTNETAASKLLETIKRTKYEIYDIDKDKYFPITKDIKSENFIVLRKGYKPPEQNSGNLKSQTTVNLGNYKIVLSDFTQKLKPDRNCVTDICKEILWNINNAQKTIDIAIYGYSTVYDIENAIKNALKRGVKIRLVYDSDFNGENIYPDTFALASLIKNSKSDKTSPEASAIMHNKFYVFDNKTVITGSANLAHTDMSGYNANVIIVIESEEIASLYKNEFNQMFSGKFHNDKLKAFNGSNVYFSPKGKALSEGVLPLIRKSRKYIYIPAFIITERNILAELIKAKSRGVDVRIIADALNASSKYSKVPDLRAAKIPVKIENYAGKMHSKSIIIDDRYLIIGSMNFSYSGENKNDENLIIIDNPEAAMFYKEFFLYLWDKIPEIWLKYNPKAEGVNSIGSCGDGIDNDYDGLIDSEDDGCKTFVPFS